MQDQASNQVVRIAIKANNLTVGKLIKALWHAYKRKAEVKSRERKAEKQLQGKVSMKKVVASHEDYQKVPLGENESLKDFKRFAKEYKIKYAFTKDLDGKETLFIHSRSMNNLGNFYQEYMQALQKKRMDKYKQNFSEHISNKVAGKKKELEKVAKSKDKDIKLNKSIER